MKLRIQDDSVRLRLTVSEVASVARGKAVVGRTRFPGRATFVYALVPGEVPVMDASLEGHAITIRLPHAEAREWAAHGERIAMRGRVDLPEGTKLYLLVEKDFACLVPRVGEDSADSFVNPRSRTAPVG